GERGTGPNPLSPFPVGKGGRRRWVSRSVGGDSCHSERSEESRCLRFGWPQTSLPWQIAQVAFPLPSREGGQGVRWEASPATYPPLPPTFTLSSCPAH